ncbi:MAG TPA: cell division protein ZapB [bacterium]|nr:cell division protein ZapB [bacterium]
MDLELLDQLEDKVDVAVSAVQDLRMENELLKEETQELEQKVESLSKSLETAGAAQGEMKTLQKRCEELEQKLGGVKSRIERMVEKMQSVAG